ncbi:P-loop containing nucleoside triphosphate hydrolase protein [Calycina marina]|uniref:DNA 3'-5' helicase n=1 Tax=Calycina marina TaxID=1763456 RepID=A0A9P8CBA8_9HELO|nr:P-loop containing nucleoside triphosphate hydrolase protein [Calycina marina]
MSAKRKASLGAIGSSKAAKGSAASTPGPATPRSSGDDDYISEDDEDGIEIEGKAKGYTNNAMKKAAVKFSVSTYKSGAPVARDSASQFFDIGKPDAEGPWSRDYSKLPLQPDHANRPLWIDPSKGRVILESFSPLAAAAQDFLVTIAEPVSRPQFLHEYILTPHSLYAAVSVGNTVDEIIKVLEKFSKTPIPENIIDFITSCGKQFGKVKLVLKNNKYLMESSDPAILQRLLQDPIVGPLRLHSEGDDIMTTSAPKVGGLVIPGTKNAAGLQQASGADQAPDEAPEDIYTTLNEDEDDDVLEVVQSFGIADHSVETVLHHCLELGLPVLEEYDFRNDDINANLDIDLKPHAQIRHYQEKALNKMFGNGRAKSGIIVLPCGAGKTLVGITAACTVKKGTLVLCTSSMSVVQWRQEFLKWSNIDESDIAVFTSGEKTAFSKSTGIIVTTYSMVSNSRNRSHDSQKMMEFLTGREWGLMILDEVHVVPANMFRKVTSALKTHSKLGLTATLLREDDKIEDLNFLIGPKLYEANWMELAAQGHIATVQCAEVWCPMTTEFYQAYLKSENRKGGLLGIMNPRKFQACQFLIDYHERRGDKIIVFSDSVYALQAYAQKLNKAYIYGETPQNERIRILENFQYNDQINTLFLSKIGDTSLDLPEATCLIQISSHYGSRRQEAQRLGRILRAKRRNDEGFNAFFYSLVSKDTKEMHFSSRRQAFLVDQGYAFKVITSLHGIDKMKDLAFNSPMARRELLQDVLTANMDEDKEAFGDDLFHLGDNKASAAARKKANARRTAGSLRDLAGGQDMAYVEGNRSRNKDLKKNAKESNPFFKKVQRDAAKIKAARANMLA